MKRFGFRAVSLGLALLLCMSAAVASETADDLSYTMSEKLMKQLDAGSGFVGTLTLTATAVAGRVGEAFTTVKPLTLNWTYIKAQGEGDAAAETRLMLTLDGGEYQQGSAELSLFNGAVYLKSSLLGDNWYLMNENALQPMLTDIGLPDALPSAAGALQSGGLLSGTASFFTNMAAYLIGANTAGMTEAMKQYTTKIDFWLESYRDSVQMTALDDGTSVMEIGYRLPPAAVKAQLKQLLIDLMNDDALLSDLTAMMPKEQSEKFLTPSLQPYYFYAVDELPLDGDLTVHRTLSFLGDTVELSVTMPLYDSVSGKSTMQYTRRQGGADMPYENTLSITSENSFAELNYHTYETMTGSTVYQGTVRVEGAEENGVKPQILWVSFDLSTQSSTTKDLNGYETQNQNLKLTVAPAEIPASEDAAAYSAFSQTDLSLDMSVASLAAKNAPTDMTLSLRLSGFHMAQDIALEMTGTTTALWTPEPFDREQAANLAAMPAEELQSLLSQAAIKGGLLILPYVNLPQIVLAGTPTTVPESTPEPAAP